MKTVIILGLLTCVALVAPVTSAHIVIHTNPDGPEDEDTDCDEPTVRGEPDLPPHVWIDLVGDCPPDHDRVPPPETLP